MHENKTKKKKKNSLDTIIFPSFTQGCVIPYGIIHVLVPEIAYKIWLTSSLFSLVYFSALNRIDSRPTANDSYKQMLHFR